MKDEKGSGLRENTIIEQIIATVVGYAIMQTLSAYLGSAVFWLGMVPFAVYWLYMKFVKHEAPKGKCMAIALGSGLLVSLLLYGCIRLSDGSNEEESADDTKTIQTEAAVEAPENTAETVKTDAVLPPKDTGVENATDVVSGTVYKGVISAESNEQFYRVTIDKPQKISIDADLSGMGYKPFVTVYGEKASDNDIIVKYQDNIPSDGFVYNPGTYYISVKASGSADESYGEYYIKVLITDDHDRNGELNTGGKSTNDAAVLKNDETVYGLLTESQRELYYTFSLDKPQQITIEVYVPNMVYEPSIILFGEAGLDRDTIYNFREKEKLDGFILNPGKYFIKVDRFGSNSASLGNYTLKLKTAPSDYCIDVGSGDTVFDLDKGEADIHSFLTYSRGENVYQFKIADNSEVDISYVEDTMTYKPQISLIDKDERAIWITAMKDGFQKNVKLNAGTYEVIVKSAGTAIESSGISHFKISKISTGTPENTGGSSFDTSALIRTDGTQVQGLLGRDYSEIFYQFVLNEPADLTISMSLDPMIVYTPTLELYDEARAKIGDNIRVGDTPFVYPDTLEAGKYYLKVKAASDLIESLGNYSFALSPVEGE